ncbi:MAG: hypothetical protein WHV66_01650 [Anaerolineales bacterium]
MPDIKHFSIVKPNLSTPFHIDFEWWRQHDNNWRIYLHSCLCEEHQAAFSDINQNSFIDWVDPQTAEVKPIDGLQNILVNHCAKQPGFVTSNTTLVDAVFRVFLANGNTPLSPIQLAQQTGKPAETILRTLSGPTVYKGIRPFHE